MKIAIFGLGYVGCISCGCFCKEGHEVIGVDPNEYKVSRVQAGLSSVVEKGLDDLISDAVTHGSLKSTTDVRQALENTEISMVCVGTPSRKDGSIDMTYVTRVSQEIAEVLAHLQKEHILVYRSTIAPGMIDKVIYPLLFYRNGLSPEKVHLAYNPEFLREGSGIFDFYHPSRTVIGVYDESQEAGHRLLKLYDFVDGEKILTSISCAQMVKYADNIFHALKITFALPKI